MTGGKELSAKLREILSDEKKRVNLLIAAGLAGMFLICASEWVPEPKEPEKSDVVLNIDYEQQLEQRLEELIGAMEGAGDTKVMVTLDENEQTVYAQDLEQSRDAESETSHSSHVLTNGSSSALVETIRQPEIRGVAVLCEGGDKAEIQLRVTELVRALTGIGPSHITVNKLCSQSK